MKGRIRKIIQQVPAEIMVTGIVFLLALFALSFIIHEAVYKREDAFDNSVINFFTVNASPVLIKSMKRVTFFGSTTFLFPAYIVLIVRRITLKDYQTAVEIAVVALSSTAMMFMLKTFFHRQRPQLPIIRGISGYSFPSGHALSSFIFCAILVHLVWKEDGPALKKYFSAVLLLTGALLIGLSRVILNVHYATDVIGGFCLGIIWVIITFAILKKFRLNSTEPDTTPVS